MFNNKNIINITLLLIMLNSCIENYTDHGFSIQNKEDLKIDHLQKGMSTKRTVAALIGEPSTKNIINNSEIWYYITWQEKQIAFLKEQITKHDIIAISFIGERMVNIEYYNIANMKPIIFAKYTTPEEKKKMSILKQLLGNIGRFDEKEGI